jgi:hypothetical protein
MKKIAYIIPGFHENRTRPAYKEIARYFKEAEQCQNRVRDAHRQIKGSKLIAVEGSKHKIGQPEYLTAVHQVVKELK